MELGNLSTKTICIICFKNIYHNQMMILSMSTLHKISINILSQAHDVKFTL